MLMNTASMGVIIPVFPSLVKTLAGQGDAGGAQIMGVFAAAWAVMSLLAAPIWGNLADRYGRRPVLLVSMFGLAFDYLIMALAPNIAWLFIGRVISGITASSQAAAGAYVADISTEENRARNFGRFQAAPTPGILMGPALGGFVGQFDPRAPFWVAAALAFANGLYGLFIVPESLASDRRAPFKWARANLFGSLGLLGGSAGLLDLRGRGPSGPVRQLVVQQHLPVLHPLPLRLGPGADRRAADRAQRRQHRHGRVRRWLGQPPVR